MMPKLTQEQMNELVEWSLSPEYLVVGVAPDGTLIFMPSHEVVDKPTLVRNVAGSTERATV